MSRRPLVTELAPGDYLWCACGESAERPFCDERAGCAPVPFTIERPTTLALCRCGLTGRAPECDGRHARLPENRPLRRLLDTLRGKG